MKKMFLRGVIAGWATYMVLYVAIGYNGLPGLYFQALIALAFAGAFSAAAIFAGWPLRGTRMREIWNAMGLTTLLPAAVGAALFIWACPLGLSRMVVDGAAGPREVMPAAWFCAAYFLCIFPFANFPERPARRTKSSH